jgi:hypothetical protein
MMLPASAMAQAGPRHRCANDVSASLPADQRAVAADAAAKTDATPLPAGATLLDCNVALATVAVPAGVTVTPSPVAASPRARIRDNGGSGNIGTIVCSLSGQPYYVSTPTYIHLQVQWSCNVYYRSMSGNGYVVTPSSGTHVKSFRQTSSNWSGSAHLEFSGVAWYGCHNRAVYEEAFFEIDGVGVLSVTTNISYI